MSRAKRKLNKGKIQVDRDGYCVKGYTRSDGTEVDGFCVAPTSFEMDDPGRPGRRARGAKKGPYKDDKPWIEREGKLGGPGYVTRPKAQRHKILDQCVDEYGYRSCLGSILVLMKNTGIRTKTRKVLTQDKDWLVKKYGGPGSFSRRKNSPSEFGGEVYEVYSAADLEQMPTLAEGQAHDLKVDDGHIRWWLSRMTEEDGEVCAVYVELLVNGRWVDVHCYGEPMTYEDLYEPEPEPEPETKPDKSARKSRMRSLNADIRRLKNRLM